jgi:4-alpha-glucanotransferase
LSSAAATRDALRGLARAHGVQLSYTAQGGRRVRTSTDSMLATLQALGVPVTSGPEIEDLLAATFATQHDQPLEPVVVVTPTGSVSTPLTVPRAGDLTSCAVIVRLEDGGSVDCPLTTAVSSSASVDGRDDLVALRLDLGVLDLPVGYHELVIQGLASRPEAMLLVPPAQRPTTARKFGVFAPIYGLRGASDWGVGSYTDLRQLADDAGQLGAELVGTLPMFPIFFEPPVDPSPYLPVSRLFVNELFIDVGALPEAATCEPARDLVSRVDFQTRLRELSNLPRVDYGQVMQLKRQVLELCADELFNGGGERRAAYEAYLGGHPNLASYADFRSAAETGADHEAQRYHRYAQFVAAEQLAAVATGGSMSRAGLYLDLPVGVHPDGYDTWSEPLAFAPATVGAPPDRLAPQGQAWGFPPLHPQRIREQRYRYVIDCYRHLFVHARAVRIDHALGLQRMFWIAQGATAEAGAYVSYRSEEFFAILAIEAARANAVVVGEDLGTVSAGIGRAMDRNAILHSFVYQFDASAATPFPQPVTPSMATLGSHDLPRFAAFWRGADIDDRVERAITEPMEARREHDERDQLVAAVAEQISDETVAGAFAACIDSLATGPAPYIMVDLADIEGETEPDNRPGTGPEADNWRWRLARPLQQIMSDPVVRQSIRGVADRREGRSSAIPANAEDVNV